LQRVQARAGGRTRKRGAVTTNELQTNEKKKKHGNSPIPRRGFRSKNYQFQHTQRKKKKKKNYLRFSFLATPERTGGGGHDQWRTKGKGGTGSWRYVIKGGETPTKGGCRGPRIHGRKEKTAFGGERENLELRMRREIPMAKKATTLAGGEGRKKKHYLPIPPTNRGTPRGLISQKNLNKGGDGDN